MRKDRIKKTKKGGGKTKIISPKIYVLILSILVILIYAKTTNFDFVNIDDGKIILNPTVTDSSIPYSEVFSKFIYGAHYKPLVFASWKAEYNMWGAAPWHFHLINWLLHLANTVLLFFIGLKLFERLYNNNKTLLLFSAFLLALLFTINPLRIESVAWATERKDVMFSFFFLISWLIYIRFIEKKKFLLIILASVIFLMSGLSKSMGITLVVVLFLTDFWYSRKFELKTVLEKIPFFLAFILLSYLYGFFNSKSPSPEAIDTVVGSLEISQKISSLDFIDNLPTSVQWLFTTSLRFILWIIHTIVPVKLSVIYPHNTIFRFFGKSIFIFPFIVMLLYFFAWKNRKKNLAVLGGLLFFGFTFAPALILKSSGQAIFLSDRYTYIPSIGLFFIMVVLLNKIKFKSLKYNIILVLIFLFYFSISLYSVNYWKNSETLFTQAIKIHPSSGLSHLNLGRYYREENKFEKALKTYNQGIARAPKHYELYSNRGKIYFDQGRFDLAIADYNKCLSFNPNYYTAVVNRGAAYGMIKEYPKAIVDLTRVIDKQPKNTNALMNRGLIYFQIKEYDKTITDYTGYLQEIPNDPDIINTVGLAYYRLKKYNLALTNYNRSISINSSNGAYFMNRSLLYNAIDDKTKALKDVLIAQQLGAKTNPKYIAYLKEQTKK